jgi:hypothetical protein
LDDGLNDGLDDINIFLNVSGLNAIEMSSRMNKSLATI